MASPLVKRIDLTKFMHRHLKANEPVAGEQGEVFISEVIQVGVRTGLRVEAVHVSNEPFIDIGTPDDLLKAAKQLMARTEKSQ